jgi:hypothetical protein
MKEQFVPYEIALKLKEKGFDEPCLGYYTQYTGIEENAFSIYSNPIKNSDINTPEWYTGKDCAAPLWQQVIGWLREKHNLRIFESTPICGQSSKSFNEDFRFELVKISGNGGHANSVFGNGGLGSRYQTYPSYNEARQAVIVHALTLI